MLKCFMKQEKNLLNFSENIFFLSESRWKAKYGAGRNILTPKQML